MKLILDSDERSYHALKLRFFLLLFLLFLCTFGRICALVESTFAERSVNGAQEARDSFIDWLLRFFFFAFLFHLVGLLSESTDFSAALLDIYYLVCIRCFNHRLLLFL